MSRFVKNPNLPQGKVSTLVCGTNDKSILGFFGGYGISVLQNAANPFVDPAVSTHADMSVLYLGDGLVLLDKNQAKLRQQLSELGFEAVETDEEIKGTYPDDVKLNFTVTQEYVIGNFGYADSRLTELIGARRKINVRQGYCKCSTLVADENAIITDDPSIHRNAVENGIDSLLISKGDIHLDGHDYGFIGGASGKIAHDTVVFFGDVTLHRDFENISAFLKKHGCGYICTDNSELRDIGGIVVLEEKSHKC